DVPGFPKRTLAVDLPRSVRRRRTAPPDAYTDAVQANRYAQRRHPCLREVSGQYYSEASLGAPVDVGFTASRVTGRPAQRSNLFKKIRQAQCRPKRRPRARVRARSAASRTTSAATSSNSAQRAQASSKATRCCQSVANQRSSSRHSKG